MPLYDCGDPDCQECQKAFGPDRTKAFKRERDREVYYAGLEAEQKSRQPKPERAL